MENIENKISWSVVNFKGETVGQIELDGFLFGVEPNPYVVQQVVTADLANRRQATAKTKVRSEVSGGGKKPWRQKGTGRARAGSSRSPIWVGGGTVFGPDGRQNYKQKVNKQVHSLALASVLSQKVLDKDLVVFDDSVKFEQPKTKELINSLKAMNAKNKVLLVINADVDSYDDNLVLAASNVEGLELVASDNVSVYDVLNAGTLIIARSVLEESEAN